jgi:spore coat polysaccharide biosynthesis protein SpsF (cytidylyltransferase family)
MRSVRVIAVVQARLGSTRLPGKALLDLAGRPMLEHVLLRAAAVPGVDQVVLATTVSPEDGALAEVARAANVACVRGSVDDVLDRFHAALAAHPADAVVRITADCPLLAPEVSGRVVSEYRRRAGELDYVSNVHPPTFPDGLDTEVIAASALERTWREARPGWEREHVTPYIWSRPDEFRLANVGGDEDLSAHRWTVDDARDLAFVREIYGRLATARGALGTASNGVGGGPSGAGTAPSAMHLMPFGMRAVLDLLRACPGLAELNSGTRRNEGLERSRLADRAAAKAYRA